MSRWPAVTVCLLVAGCAPAFEPGFANAPALGGSPVATARAVDGVSNGDDACRTADEGTVLRYKEPPCPEVEATTHAPPVLVEPPAVPADDALVVHWLHRIYVCRAQPESAFQTVAYTPGASNCLP